MGPSGRWRYENNYSSNLFGKKFFFFFTILQDILNVFKKFTHLYLWDKCHTCIYYSIASAELYILSHYSFLSSNSLDSWQWLWVFPLIYVNLPLFFQNLWTYFYMPKTKMDGRNVNGQDICQIDLKWFSIVTFYI